MHPELEGCKDMTAQATGMSEAVCPCKYFLHAVFFHAIRFSLVQSLKWL